MKINPSYQNNLKMPKFNFRRVCFKNRRFFAHEFKLSRQLELIRSLIEKKSFSKKKEEFQSFAQLFKVSN